MILVVNLIPKSMSGETNQDSEPNLAVSPSNPQFIAASAFTPDPLGGAKAPIFISKDGGNTWQLNAIVPSQAGKVPPTGDITLRFSTKGNRLYAGILRLPGTFRLNILRTANFAGAGTMTVLVDRNNVDQPYVQAATVEGGPDDGKDRVYVGDNDLALVPPGSGRTATVDLSLDAAVAAPPPPSGFRTARIETRT